MKKIVRFGLLLLVSIFLLSVLINKSKGLISPFLKPNLKQTIEQSLSGTKGRYGIFVKNLKSDESFFLNRDQKFEAGSLYKLWVMGAIYEKIASGDLKEDKSIEGDIASLNKIFGISDKEAELSRGYLQYTINSAIEQMITISHNYAALMLTREAGNEALEEFLSKYGFKDSSLSPPKTTPEGIGLFFEKLYQGEIVSKEYSQKMLEVLSRQKINDRIPKFLPEEVKIAHKTADIGYFENDGGIVFTPQGDYIIVILSESEFPDAAGDRIAKLSKAVYDYFMRK